MQENKRGSFTGSLGFVLAAAGSAVGLGNIWRFPYLAAKDGGGIFLLVYVVLALTFGIALMTTEISIGRKTRQSPLTAYGKLHSKWKFLGVIACIVPTIILPYYCAIGGWVLRYFTAFITGNGSSAAEDGNFTGFITQVNAPIIFMIIFLAATFFIVYLGVDKGIESCSKIMMPILLVMIICIGVFGLRIQNTDGNGVTRTGLDGLKIYVIPNLEGMTIRKFLSVCVDAMGQLFYSLSVAMGIMIAYGSYMKDDVSISKSVNQIEFFDSLVAFLAGMMIVPTVYVFMGTDGMSAGPGLMFVTLPKVFTAMGKAGLLIGVAFFLMVLFAALTSSVSIMEAIVSSLMDHKGVTRRRACIGCSIYALAAGIVVCLGYNVLYFEFQLPNGSTAQILDIMDYVSNNVLMPIVSILTCVLIGWVLKPQVIIDEVEKNGKKMRKKALYVGMIRFVAPVLLLVLLLRSLGIL
jgi:neurotransmitter:Na+ symporter, NSS family